MPSAIRVRMNPLDSPFGDSGQTISDGARVSLAASGPVGSELDVDTPTPAKLTFEGRFIDRVRAQGQGDEVRKLATLAGQLLRSKGRQPTLTFTGSQGDDGKPECLVPDEVISEQDDADSAEDSNSDGGADSDSDGSSDSDGGPDSDGGADSDSNSDGGADSDSDGGADSDSDDETDATDASEVRVLRFAFESDQFVGVNPDPASDTTELLLRIDPTSFHYLEVSVTLELADAAEAPRSANDLLDVLISARNPGRHLIVALRLTDETGQAIPNAACRIISGAKPADQAADPSALAAERIPSGVRRVGQSLCAISRSGGVVSLAGAGCQLSSGDLVELPMENERESCDLKPDGSVYCSNGHGPRRWVLSHVEQLEPGGTFFCARRSGGQIWCWGTNIEGGLGDGQNHESKIPVRVRVAKPALTLGVGWKHACALLAGGDVSCWGENSRGAVGVGQLPSAGDIPIPGSPPEYLLPQRAVRLSAVVPLRVFGDQTCALTEKGDVYCWGDSRTDPPNPTPTRIEGLPPVAEVSIGVPTCIVTREGDTSCWGDSCPLSGLQAKPQPVDWATTQ